jgi:uracil-DNA glycosylase family 4
VLIGNVNRCRPPNNRTPTTEEARTCKPFLLREINIARPDVIVVLGNTAMKNLLDTKEGITRLRGEFQDYRGIKVMPTFHPAYLLARPLEEARSLGRHEEGSRLPQRDEGQEVGIVIDDAGLTFRRTGSGFK